MPSNKCFKRIIYLCFILKLKQYLYFINLSIQIRLFDLDSCKFFIVERFIFFNLIIDTFDSYLVGKLRKWSGLKNLFFLRGSFGIYLKLEQFYWLSVQQVNTHILILLKKLDNSVILVLQLKWVIIFFYKKHFFNVFLKFIKKEFI